MVTENLITPSQKIFENPTVNLSALCKSCVQIAFCSSELIFTFCSSELIFTFLYVGSSIQNASEHFVSCIHLCFVSFPVHPNPQTKNWQIWARRFKQLCFSDQSILAHMNFIPHND
jgi:hypothetical protein